MEIQKVAKRKTSPEPEPLGGDARKQAYLDQVKAMIRDNGWAMQIVAPDAGVTYVYTIGLVERKCTAELMIAGLPYQMAAEVLNQIASNMLNHSQMIPPTEWPLAGGFVLKSKTFVPQVGGDFHVGVARAYYGRDVVMAQYVWPDAEHRYPWDEGWDSTLLQPVGNK